MTSMNKVCLVGRVGQDPDVKYFESGKVKASFSFAVDQGKNRDAQWYSIESWGKTAEVVALYVQKGKLLSIEGYLKIESWTDKKTGDTRTKPLIACDRLQMLGGKREEGNDKPTYSSTQNQPDDDDDDKMPM